MERHTRQQQDRFEDVEDRWLPGFRGISDRLAVSGGRLTASEKARRGNTRRRGLRPLLGRTYTRRDRQRVHANASRYLACACARSAKGVRSRPARERAKGATRRG